MTIGRGLTESSSSRARAVLTAELSAIRLAAIGAMLAISEVRSIVVAYMLVSRWSSVVLLETSIAEATKAAILVPSRGVILFSEAVGIVVDTDLAFGRSVSLLTWPELASATGPVLVSSSEVIAVGFATASAEAVISVAISVKHAGTAMATGVVASR